MYNKVKIFFLFINFYILNAQIGTWEIVDSTGNAIDYRISCYDDSNCIATMWTPHPTISYLRCFVAKYSGNGGKSWIRYHYDCARDLFDSLTFRYYWHQPEAIKEISFSASSKVFAILDTNKFMQSYDFGKHWKRTVIDSNLYRNWAKTDIIFTINNDAYGVVASVSPYDIINPQYGRLFITLDSFQTWKRIDLTSYPDIQIIKKIALPSRNVLFLLSYLPEYNRYTFWLSRDSGKTWSAQYSTYTFPEESPPDVYCFDTANCWFAGIMKINNEYKNVIYYTKDLGRNWDLQLNKATSITTGLFKIIFIDEGNGYAFSKRYGYRTTNGGKSWSEILDTLGIQFPRVFSNYAVVSPTSFLAVTQWDLIYRFSLLETSFNENYNSKSIIITPNPAKDNINIKISDNINFYCNYLTINDIIIFNSLGECIIKQNIENYNKTNVEFNIDISYLPRGVYYLKLGNLVNRFIKI